MTTAIHRITYRDITVELTRDNDAEVRATLDASAADDAPGLIRYRLHMLGAHLLSADMLEAERLAEHPRANEIYVDMQSRWSQGSLFTTLRDALLAFTRGDGSPYDAGARVLVSTSPAWVPNDAHPSGGHMDSEWGDSVYLLDYARRVLAESPPIEFVPAPTAPCSHYGCTHPVAKSGDRIRIYYRGTPYESWSHFGHGNEGQAAGDLARTRAAREARGEVEPVVPSVVVVE